MQVHLSQHVFAHLTKDQSPKGLSREQTLFYTRNAMSEADVRVIEDRIKYFAGQTETAKWQFFWLPSHKAVVTRIVAVPDLDDFGRKGRYLAHSLIITENDWRKFADSPFDFLQAERFCRSIGEALKLGDPDAGQIREVTREVRPSWHQQAENLAKSWPREEQIKLSRLAIRARSITSAGQYVAFIGNEQQILDALCVAFFFAPEVGRKHCSFDTAAAGCRWPNGVTFWGQGFTDGREARTTYIVDAGRRRVQLPTAMNDKPSPYERWLEPLIQSGSLSQIFRQQDGAYALSQLLNGETPEPSRLREVDSVFKNHFAGICHEEIKERIESLLPPQLPPTHHSGIFLRMGSSTVERLNWLIDNPAGEALVDILFETVADFSETPGSELLQTLVAMAGRHRGLGLLLALWGKDEARARQCLTAMTADEYQRHVKMLWSNDKFEMWQFFSPSYVDYWVRIYKHSPRTANKSELNVLADICKGITSVVKYGKPEDYDRLADLVGILEDAAESRKTLLVWLREQSFKKRLSKLQDALEKSLPPDPTNSTEKSKWRSLFNR